MRIRNVSLALVLSASVLWAQTADDDALGLGTSPLNELPRRVQLMLRVSF